MKSKLISVIKYVLVLGIAIALLWVAFRGIPVKDTIEKIKNANYFWVFASVFVSLIAFYSRALRWNMLIEPLGFRPTSNETTAALMVGYFANLLVPRLGEVTRCGSLSKVGNIPFNSLLGTVIIERLIDVLCLLICIIIVAMLEFNRLGNFLNQNIFIPVTSKLSSLYNHPFLTFTIAILLIGIIYFILRRKSGTGGFADKFSKLLKGVLNGVDTVRKVKSPTLFIFHTILIWAMYFFMSYLCFSALESTASLDMHAGLFVLVVGGMAMSAPVQGGVGAYHLLVSQGLLLYGIALEDGITFATLMHTSQTLVVIVFGALSFLYLSLKKKNATLKHTGDHSPQNHRERHSES